MSSARRRLRRGQSEIIGAAIALSLLIAVGFTIFSSFFRSTTQVSAGISTRYRFESERAAELKTLEVRYGEDRKCRLVNTGSLDVRIVRVWWANGTYRDSSFLRVSVLRPGEDDGGELYTLGVGYAVTSRGNIISIRSACDVKKAVVGGTLIMIEGLSSENYLNSSRIIGNDLTKIIVTKIVKGDSVGNVGVLYYFMNMWYYNKGYQTFGWELNRTPVSSTVEEDLDDNGINELIVANETEEEIEVRQGRRKETIRRTVISAYSTDLNQNNKLLVNITFVNLLRVLENPDIVTIHFKVLALVSTPPAQGISVGASVTIGSSDRSVASSASTSSGSFTKRQKYVLIIVGSVSFPIRAYEVLKQILVPGLYDLTLTIQFVPTSAGSAINISDIRLEYVAITGSASIEWRP